MPTDNTELTVDPIPRAVAECAKWLQWCLRIGWPKSALDDLEKLWWKHHDRFGELKQ